MLRTPLRWAALAVLVLIPCAACANDANPSSDLPGSSSVPVGKVRVLIGDLAVDELLSFSAQLVAVRLVDEDGGTSKNVLSAPLRVEFLGLQRFNLWLSEADVETGTYEAVQVEFAPGSYVARAFDGTFVPVTSTSDVLNAALLSPHMLTEGELVSMLVDLDLDLSLSGDVPTGPLTFAPTGTTRAADPGESLRVDELSATVRSRDAATLALVVDVFADDELTVPVGPVSVDVDFPTLLIDIDGDPLQPPQSLFFTVLAPAITILDLNGRLVSDGPFLAERIEIDDQNGVPGNSFPVKLDGRIVAQRPGVVSFEVQEIEQGENIAGPILVGLGDAPVIEVSLSTQLLRVFSGNSIVLPFDLLVGQRMKIKFVSFPAPPFPAARIDVKGMIPGFRGTITNTDLVPQSMFMTVPAGALPIRAGLVESDTTPVEVAPLSGRPITLWSLGDPFLSPLDLVPGLDIVVNGGFGGNPPFPTFDPTRIRVRPGALVGARVVATDPARSTFTTLEGFLVRSFGDGVMPGPLSTTFELNAILIGDAVTKAGFYSLFDGLEGGEQLFVDLQGIGTGGLGQIRAFTVRSYVD